MDSAQLLADGGVDVFRHAAVHVLHTARIARRVIVYLGYATVPVTRQSSVAVIGVFRRAAVGVVGEVECTLVEQRRGVVLDADNAVAVERDVKVVYLAILPSCFSPRRWKRSIAPFSVYSNTVSL